MNDLEVIERNNDKYILTLFELYLDGKYKSIRDQIKRKISDYTESSTCEYSEIIDLVNDSTDVGLLSELIRTFDSNNIIKYALDLFENKTDFRESLIENLGSKILKYEHVLKLYDTDDVELKSNVLFSTGFMKSQDINSWLVQRLYDDNENLSSSAVFSLSKHGSAGFSLLSRNLKNLSTRLTLISIDLLTYNKVEEAYKYFPELLIIPNDLIGERVIKSFKSLGNKSTKYIIESLRVSSIRFKIPLLKLLEDINQDDYIDEIRSLLIYPELQDYIIDLYFTKNAFYLLRDLLLYPTIDLSDKIITYGIQNNSDILFKDSIISEFTLNYFLENYSIDIVAQYFFNTGFDKNYIDDYERVTTISNNLSFITSIEKDNGEVDYISRYFEFEQSRSIAKMESDVFFSGMKDWLESGDINSLNESILLNEANNPKEQTLDFEKKSFINSLPEIEKNNILKYEKSLIDIGRDYRNLTYRLKTFAKNLISKYGYLHLIE